MSNESFQSHARQTYNPDAGSVLNAKWGREVMALGYTVVPDILLTRMAALGLKPAELLLIMQILRFWWSPNQLPFPSKRKLAEAIGYSERNVQRMITRLVKLKFIRRIERKCEADCNDSNVYDLGPLIARLKPLAIAEAAGRGAYGARAADVAVREAGKYASASPPAPRRGVSGEPI
jgi:Helix-turn-helix domain